MKIVTLQKVIRGWHYRNKFHKMKTCTVVIQAAWRAYHEKRAYEAVRNINVLAFFSVVRFVEDITYTNVFYNDKVGLFCFFIDETRLHETSSSGAFTIIDTSLHPTEVKDGHFATPLPCLSLQNLV